MMRMLLMSVRLGMGIVHQLGEAVEQVADVVRPGTGLGVPLEAKRRSVSTGEPLEGTVEERDVGRAQRGWDRGRVDSEPMILAGDDHAPGIQVLHGMVR